MLGKENLAIVGQNSSNINHNDYENDRGRYRQMRVLRRSTKKVFKRDITFLSKTHSYLGNVLLKLAVLGPTLEAVFESVLVLLVRVLLVTKLAPKGSLDSVNKTGS